uniref:Laminin G domain-containing protein n=1 Tax=Phasianus colchicus TaxID=9054 RepID=A0A669R1P9_PHACC
MHLGAERTRRGRISPAAPTKILLLCIAICTAAGAVKAPKQAVDVLHQLGLVSEVQQPSVTPVPSAVPLLPRGVRLAVSGVVLTADACVEASVAQVIPASLGHHFTILVGLYSYTVNNAFLFSIRNKTRLLFGVQLLPRKVAVHTGGKQPVYFDYSVHNEQWHWFAIEIRYKTVSMFAECGQKYYIREMLYEVEAFDLDGLFTLGRMNSHSVSFEGVICQLDIIPSAEASANYCKYMKQQCRQAETYRSLLGTPYASGVLDVSLKKKIGEKKQWEDVSYRRKEVSNGPVTDIARIHSVLEYLESINVSTSEFAESKPLLLEVWPETEVQEEVSLLLHHQEPSKERGGTGKNKASYSNTSHTTTEDADRQNELSQIFPVKQSKMKNKGVDKEKQHLDEPTKKQQIFNTTLYSLTADLSLDNQLSLEEEGPFDANNTYRTENTYYVDNYNYEDQGKIFEIGSSRGLKGETGPPVSYLYYTLYYNEATYI